MACRPGEENVATLFGDVHYFYGSPSTDPPHHRFDKGSYVYLFENAAERRARIEIANHPGTEAQDAFDGVLDSVQVRYSYKQQCVVGMTIGHVPNHEEWHLPWYDPRNETKYHYKLHSLDVYFWTQADALQFVNGVRRVLPQQQVEVLDEPAPPPRQFQPPPSAADTSGLVQKLENAAISTEAGTERAGSGASGGALSFAPPPMSAVSGANSDNPPSSSSLPPPPPPQNFAPMAYNPAAPAAPEAIRHREKTPPPPDGGLNPLQQTLAYDAGTPFSPGLAPSGMSGPLSPAIPPPQFGQVPGAPSFPGPPQPQGVSSPGMAPAGFGQHPHPGLSRAHTVPVQSFGTPLASPYGSAFPGSPGFPPNQQMSHPSLPQTQNPTPPAPGTPGLPPPPPPPASAPLTSKATAGMVPMDYSIHQQAYRPDEGEMEHKTKFKSDRETRKLESSAYRLEKGVTGMFKKFEKKFG
ncbi:hypothetical protein MGG_04655 [Pyricularia oryzae 70-15]|uniref:RNA recognition motif-containing protein n=3 Tax=Pyricularia oryzae TaxID=318829 RepID=G4MT96_PYRO7|nr:uncharacterized protein MGG_04655 [Pyricularia oryzae 70-15]EHA53842.1 hypothetical protein MGG_04655 [Pyricularia oryzae 70-15]ELQ34670.1 hypothetical protein OOU_Y34scaffold00749g5 [Pyricularia oryzae Y34]KAI7920928.1 hypothetical protein M0657_006391 [Pyricularia oryzae]KAI7931092.1 hypothetical protein M9X92_000378 [Pyricularia oryzae]